MKKIAYIHIYAGAPVATSVWQMLADSFPEYEIETITLTHLFKRRPGLMAINALQVLGTYGPKAFGSKAALRRRFIATPYLFHRVREILLATLGRRASEFAFSFQLQSLFDAHIPGLPHYVYTDHTHLENLSYADFDRSHLHSPAWIELEKSIYANATHIFTRSSNISESLVAQYGIPEQKVTCAYAGVNAPSPAGSADNEAYTNKKILFVGLDWERKGGPTLVAAFQRVLQAHPEARLTIAGAHPQLEAPNIEVLGPLSLEEVHRQYQEASIFCLPTQREPFGIVFVEALAHGLPIVATRIGAIPDMVIEGENGYLVEPGDVDGLARALNVLLADASRRRAFGARGKALASIRYNWCSVGALMRERIAQLQALPPTSQPGNSIPATSRPAAA